ncbi:MAG: Putrescine transport system permease protein PotH, partial [uncultured Nocardioidaceae bacterium]
DARRGGSGRGVGRTAGEGAGRGLAPAPDVGLAAPAAGDGLARDVLPLPRGAAVLHVVVRPERLLRRRLHDDMGVRQLRRRAARHLEPVPALVQLRRDRDGRLPAARLPVGLRDRVQGRPVEVRHARARHRAVLHQLPAADALVAHHPLRQRAGDQLPADDRGAARRRPAAGDAGGGHRRADLQLPAVHDAADLRLARQGRPPARRGRGRPVLEPVHGLPQGDAAVVDARRRVRHAADLHPGLRRLHQRRAARDPEGVHGGQPHPGGLPDRAQLPAGREPVAVADGARRDARRGLRATRRHRGPRV